MRYKAVLLDAFGTILQINPGKHPYRQLLKEGLKNGRRSSPDDVKNLMRFNGGLSEAADHLGISVHPSRLAEIEKILEDEVSSIEAFPDALEAVALLQERSRLVAVCSNLAYPYGRAVKTLFPTMDAFGFSYEIGLVKPDPRMYQATCEMIGVESDNGFGENRVIMVGDSLRCDCHGPREVGITGIHLDRSKDEGINDLMVFAGHVLCES
ncbi:MULTISPECIES: HAD family hydrolase [Pseudomonas]|uniref:HAD family hydrolase n=3 Tax=Pseudomonas TaxID=286 RepID=A0A8T8LZN1_PSESX|nr:MULTISPECIES: HAD family hydrolase [Pseudomonas]MEE4667147.1 HAD family hydrolase [Pseudomonas alliivorans]MBF7141968.1 HAD family hydrolase [Pseudomonas sp. LY10J]NJP00506.1 HAD family hydrolase [Pseudomonas quercus]QUP66633.1 HAD family hydrolase [Pseudomonas syringae Cit 7]SDT53216.1 haloacid dehalogenase superfamily, subfamily IA, variant 1 with third motif having Dx(3-4)D or Dx(3-4)E [Pseudomonas syringae]